MDPFNIHTGIVATLPRANVDTDQIIPKQFLKSIKRTGFGESLFYDWRYLDDGSDNPDFELNQDAFKGASILVAGNNFGCGSSREHAVWAVAQYGLRAIVAPRRTGEQGVIPGFADIFRNNCVKNGILTIELDEQPVQELFKMVAEHKPVEAVVDLSEQTLSVPAADWNIRFEVDPAVKDTLLQGLDDIAQSLEKIDAIKVFEQTHDTQLPAG